MLTALMKVTFTSPTSLSLRALAILRFLPRDYRKKADIELVFREMAEQVAIRLRRAHKKATNVSIYVGFSKQEKKRRIQAQMKIEPICLQSTD